MIGQPGETSVSTSSLHDLLPAVVWAARLTGLVLGGFILFMAVANGFNPFNLTSTEAVLSMGLFAAAAGMFVLWRFPAIGGAMVLLGTAAFIGFDVAFSGHFLRFAFPLLFFVPGILSLVGCCLTRTQG